MEKHLVDFNSGKSLVWRYFGFWKCGNSVNKDKVVCKICNTEYAYTGNTTTLRKHIMVKHPDKSLTSSEKSTQPTISSLMPANRANLGPLPYAKQQEYNQAICEFLIEDIRPVSTVEGVGFRNLLQKFEPR